MSKISDLRHEEILKAAAAEFFSRGVEAASMSDIAARAGIGKSTIYEYFPSKAELFAAVCKQLIGRMEEENSAIFASRCPFREKISRYCNSFLEILHEVCDGHNSITSVAAMLSTTPYMAEISKYVQHFNLSIFDGLKAAILEAQAAGEVRSDLDADVAASYLLCLPNPHLFQKLRVLGKNPVDEVVELAIRGMLPHETIAKT